VAIRTLSSEGIQAPRALKRMKVACCVPAMVDDKFLSGQWTACCAGLTLYEFLLLNAHICPFPPGVWNNSCENLWGSCFGEVWYQY